jgi:hypothetical protein
MLWPFPMYATTPALLLLLLFCMNNSWLYDTQEMQVHAKLGYMNNNTFPSLGACEGAYVLLNNSTTLLLLLLYGASCTLRSRWWPSGSTAVHRLLVFGEIFLRRVTVGK